MPAATSPVTMPLSSERKTTFGSIPFAAADPHRACSLCRTGTRSSGSSPISRRVSGAASGRGSKIHPMALTVRGACPLDCPDTCAWHVTVEDGRAVELRGDREHPFTRGALCGKVDHYLDALHSPDRLLYPLRRVGAKGEGRFERDLLGRGDRARRQPACAARSSATAPSRSSRTTTRGRWATSRAGRSARACSPRSAPRGSTRRSAPPPRRRRCERRSAESVGYDPEDLPHAPARRPLGCEPALDEHPSVAVRARGARARGAHRHHRPDPDRHGGALGRARRAAPRHGRGARTGPDARGARRGRRGPRLARAAHGRLAGARETARRVAGRARGGRLRARRGRRTAARRAAGDDAADRDPPRPRPAAARRRRRGDPGDPAPSRP